MPLSRRFGLERAIDEMKWNMVRWSEMGRRNGWNFVPKARGRNRDGVEFVRGTGMLVSALRFAVPSVETSWNAAKSDTISRAIPEKPEGYEIAHEKND